MIWSESPSEWISFYLHFFSKYIMKFHYRNPNEWFSLLACQQFSYLCCRDIAHFNSLWRRRAQWLLLIINGDSLMSSRVTRLAGHFIVSWDGVRITTEEKSFIPLTLILYNHIYLSEPASSFTRIHRLYYRWLSQIARKWNLRSHSHCQRSV